MVQGVFAEKWCEISPFLLFLDKKQLKKDYVVGGKNVTFFQNYRSGRGSFAENCSEISPFFFRQKQLKKDYAVGGKNVAFFQNYRSGTGSFC